VPIIEDGQKRRKEENKEGETVGSTDGARTANA
jgi:hypothetical protein